MLSINPSPSENNRLLDKLFQQVKPWMNQKEIKDYLEARDKPGILFTNILSRYKQIRKSIKHLQSKTTSINKKTLSQLDESIQVKHFFYQAALVKLYQDIREHTRKIQNLLNRIKEESVNTQEEPITTTETQLLKLIKEHSDFYTNNTTYEYIHFNLLSLLETAQKLLYTEENPNEETKIHIYNLLDLAKDLLQKDQYEFLDKLKEYAKWNQNKEL